MSEETDPSNYVSPESESPVPEAVIRAGQVRQLYSQVRVGMVGAIVAALGIAALLWQEIPRERLVVWLGVFLAVQIPRHVLVRRFRQIDPRRADALPWGAWFLLGSAATAFLLGMSSIVLFPANSFVHQCTLAVFLAGFAASTAAAHAPLRECYLSSVLLTLVPVLARFLYQGGEPSIVVAIVGSAFAAAVLSTGNSLNRMIATSIRLRFERDEVVSNLEQAHELLEARVSDRTLELARHNEMLLREVRERQEAEEALRVEKERFQALAEHLPLGLASISEDGSFQYVNRKFTDLFGYDLQDIPGGRKWFRLAYPDPEYRRQVISRWIHDLDKASPGEQRPREYNVTCKDGLIKTVFFRPVQLATGEHLMTCEDVTERNMAEDRLRTSEQQYRMLAQNISDVIWTMDLNLNLTYVSPSVERMHGWNPREWLSFQPSDYLVPSSLELVSKVLGEQFALQNSPEADPDQVTTLEVEQYRKDGTTFWTELTARFLYDESQRPAGIIGTTRDVTDRKRAEEALRESEERYRAVFDNAAVGINVVDAKGTLLQVNSAFAHMLGYSRDELMTKTIFDITHPDDLKISRERHDSMIRGESASHRLEKRYVKKDGQFIWGDVSVSTLGGPDRGEIATIGVIVDITESRSMQDAIKGIVEGVSGEIGERFFESSVTHFARILGADFTLIAEILHQDSGSTLRTIAFSAHGELQDNFEYDLKGSPCEEVTKRLVCAYPRGVARLFPKDVGLQANGIEAYVGVGLYDSRGKPMGVMAAMYTTPLENVRFTEAVLRIFAARAASEIERNTAEEALRDSEATLRTLLQAAPIGIGQVSSDRTLGWTNQVLCNMLGYSREELAGQSARIVYESEEEFLRVGREKHPDVIKYGTGSVETRFRRKDGSVFDVLLRASVVFPNDLSYGMVFTAMDITERKRSEHELRRLVAAVESAGETMVVTDSQGSIIYVNPSFEETTGYSRQEALGKNPRILKSGKHDRDFYREMWDTLLAGHVWRGRFTNKKKDGTFYEETATISPIKDESGRTVNYVAVKRDVTGESMLQKQLLHAQKMEAIGTLAGGMAHDFNNLLQAILGYSDLLLMGMRHEDSDRKKLEVIQHAARDGADLVSRILTFSKKADPKTRPIDLNQEIRRAQRLLRRTIPRMIDIKLVLAEDLQIIDADPAQVEQILLNLAVNAHHAMPDGGQLLVETSNVSLSHEYLRTHLDAKAGHYVMLTVSDTGIGIEADVLDRVFEPFFTTKTDGEGTGLGLSMVHGIVSQHGGHIRCYSEPPQRDGL